MKSDEVIVLLLAIFLGLPFGVWFFQDNIFAVLQAIDLAILKVLSFVPFVAGYYRDVESSYASLAPSQLTFQHIWIASGIAWRPVMVLFMSPLLARWAWKAWQKRRAQAFNKIDKSFIDKHCGIKQSAPGTGARQQWKPRKWFHFYGLHKLEWGSAEWHVAVHKAFKLQLGAPVAGNEGLVREFAEFIHEREVKRQFGKKAAAMLTVDVMVKEACQQHYYLSTAIVRILAATRDQFGVISPNGFRNRLFQDPKTVPIWFALSGLTRQTTHIESIAILSHFYCEICEKQALSKPHLDSAFDGLEMLRDQKVNLNKLADLDESANYRESQPATLSEADSAHSYDMGQTAIQLKN